MIANSEKKQTHRNNKELGYINYNRTKSVTVCLLYDCTCTALLENCKRSFWLCCPAVSCSVICFISYLMDNYNNAVNCSLLLHYLFVSRSVIRYVRSSSNFWITHLNLNLTSFSRQSIYRRVGELCMQISVDWALIVKRYHTSTLRRVNDHRRAYLAAWRNKTDIGNVKISARRPITVDDTPMKPRAVTLQWY